MSSNIIKPGINSTTFNVSIPSGWGGLSNSSHLHDHWKTPGYKMKKSDLIKAKCNLLRKMDLSIRTEWDLKTICQTLVQTYQNFNWKNSNLEETMSVCIDLLNSNNEEDLIIVVEILKNLERK